MGGRLKMNRRTSAIGIMAGCLLGVALSVVFENVGLGNAISIVLGVATGMVSAMAIASARR
jgi:sulfopyruvate decarboxylase TPP-binding subunit